MARTTGSQYIQLPDLVDFDWDPAKNDSNIAKHGIDFDRAIRAFGDPNRIIKDSSRDHADEMRYLLTGLLNPTGSEIVSVAFTIRDNVVRVFSARSASRRERRKYREGTALR